MGIRLPTYAPFDSIIVTAGHHLSTTFDGAIKIGGGLVIPLGKKFKL
jgi:protein-L-isoaspartate O-methyltransferase